MHNKIRKELLQPNKEHIPPESTDNVFLMMEKPNDFSLRPETTLSTLTTSVPHCTINSRHYSQASKKDKRHLEWKEKGKVSLFSFLNTTVRKSDGTYETAGTAKFCKVMGYRINVEISMALLYTSNKQFEI